MTFDPTKPCKLLDGRPAEIVHTLPDGRPVVVITCDDGGQWANIYAANGSYYGNGLTDDSLDLINIPTKREGWVPVLLNLDLNARDWVAGSPVFTTKDAAEAAWAGHPRFIAAAHIEWEE